MQACPQRPSIIQMNGPWSGEGGGRASNILSGLSAVTTSIGKEDQVMQMWMKRRYELQTAQGSQQTRRQRGFTLIEIMVVIAILGILAALIVPKIMSRPDEARRVAAKADIGSIMQSLNLYRLDNGRYPTQEQGLRALVEKPTTEPVPNNWKGGGYMDRVPMDPWGKEYQYLNPGVHGEVDIFSYGADSKPGGEGNDADIGSWQ
jgi:general secretion pathway protein G